VKVTRFTAVPGRAAAGAPVTLKWTAQQAVRLELNDGSGGPPQDVTSSSQSVVNPTVTTVYTLTAFAKDGRTPGSASAIAVARVAPPTVVTSFTATPDSIEQGSPSTLRWDGNATSWAINDGTAPTNLGPMKVLQVQPSTTTAYTLIATGPGGTVSNSPVTVTVAPKVGTTLVYTPPTSGALQLLADDCPTPCTAITLRVKGTVPMRGLALDLPLDVSKVSFDPTSFGSDLATNSKAVLGNGPLQGVLVLGVARTGDGTSPASDITLPEVAHFTLTLVPAGGVGPVFNGSALAANPRFNAVVQSASGRAAGAIAIGTLAAQSQ